MNMFNILPFQLIRSYTKVLSSFGLKSIQVIILLIGCFTISVNGAKHKVGPKTIAVNTGECCPPELSINCNSLAWSSIDTIINTSGSPIASFRLHNAIHLPAGFPSPTRVYVTELNSYREDTLRINGVKVKLFLNTGVTNNAINHASYPVSSTFQWVGYESNAFTLDTGRRAYRLVYVWDAFTPLPCRYFTGRQWNSDNVISLPDPASAPTTLMSPNGILICKKNVRCDDTAKGSIVAVPKCFTPPAPPPPPSDPYYILLGGLVSPDTNTNGFYNGLEPGNYTLYLLDSLSSTLLDSNLFSIIIEPKILSDTTIIACDSFVWNGVTYTASGIYIDTTIGSYYSTSCLLLDILNLTIIPCNGAIPTLSEWGIILMLLLFAASTMHFIYKRRTALVMTESHSAMNPVLFDKNIFFKILVILLALAIAILIASYFYFGSVTRIDIIGTVLSSAIITYMLHLFELGRK